MATGFLKRNDEKEGEIFHHLSGNASKSLNVCVAFQPADSQWSSFPSILLWAISEFVKGKKRSEVMCFTPVSPTGKDHSAAQWEAAAIVSLTLLLPCLPNILLAYYILGVGRRQVCQIREWEKKDQWSHNYHWRDGTAVWVTRDLQPWYSFGT